MPLTPLPPNQKSDGFPLEFLLKGPQTELRALSQNCEQTLPKLRTKRIYEQTGVHLIICAHLRVSASARVRQCFGTADPCLPSPCCADQTRYRACSWRPRSVLGWEQQRGKPGQTCTQHLLRSKGGGCLVAWAIRNAIRANRFARIIRN